MLQRAVLVVEVIEDVDDEQSVVHSTVFPSTPDWKRLRFFGSLAAGLSSGVPDKP
jgi:hypothetical protein